MGAGAAIEVFTQMLDAPPGTGLATATLVGVFFSNLISFLRDQEIIK